MEQMFHSFSNILEQESQIREEIKQVVKEIDKICRQQTAIMQGIHSKEYISNPQAVCAKARELYPELRPLFAKLQQIVQPDVYFKYRDHWKFTLSNLVFIAALIKWLEDGTLISISEVEQLLGVQSQGKNAFCVELEDYLFGVCSLPNELSRLCVNCVTAGDFERPRKIAQFVSDLQSGFRLLNLKNDNLRKKYDGIKYDMKKIEEVVYDLTIRKLSPTTEVGDTHEMHQ